MARHTLKLTSGLATGMAIDSEIAQAEPAAIGAIRSWTEMLSSIDGAPAAPGEEERTRHG